LPDGLFSSQKSQFWSILECLCRENLSIFYDHLEHFTAIWYNFWPLKIDEKLSKLDGKILSKLHGKKLSKLDEIILSKLDEIILSKLDEIFFVKIR
jgi:hypothetical protein